MDSRPSRSRNPGWLAWEPSRAPRGGLLASLPRFCPLHESCAGRHQSVQRRRALLARFPVLRTAWMAVRRVLQSRDLANMIVWGTDLAAWIFHCETQTLRDERLVQYGFPERRSCDCEFACLLHVTRFLKLDANVATLLPGKITDPLRTPHMTPHGRCCVDGVVYARVRRPSESRLACAAWRRNRVLESEPQHQAPEEPPQ
jgi:hypothetical protein